MKRAPINPPLNIELAERKGSFNQPWKNYKKMKNSIIIGSLLLLVACGGGENAASIESLIAEGNTEALKAKKTEILAGIKEAEQELTAIEEALAEEGVEKKKPLVSVFKVDLVPFEHFVELQGSVETDQNILVYPEFQGTLLNFKAKMGDRVSKGDVIATIDDGGLRQQLAQMEEQLALSKITYERQKKLWDQKIGSELDFLRAETNFHANEESVKQMKAQLAKATVTAPFSGQIDETLADEGQLVTPGQTPLFRLVNLKDMYVQADVPEKYLKTVKVGRKVMVDLPVLDTSIVTMVNKVSNYINPDNRTFKIEIDVPNKGGLVKPNLTSKLRVNDYSSAEAILIPQSIISEDSEGRQYVYTVSGTADAAKAHKSFLKTGLKEGDLIEVLEGLQNGDVVIQEGARTVKDNQEVKIIK
jgi:RND family efflux transporter MFP subunit